MTQPRRRVRYVATRKKHDSGPFELSIQEFEAQYGQAPSYQRYLNGRVRFMLDHPGQPRVISIEGDGPCYPNPPEPPHSFLNDGAPRL